MKNPDALSLTANHWGTYRVETRDGKVRALHAFEEDPDPSPIGPGILDVLDGPTRIKAPMVRKSWLDYGPGARTEKRGAEPFVEVSWDQAEQLVADELNRVRKTFGNAAIFAGSYGWASAGRFHHAQSQMRRFLNCVGGFTRSVNTYSFAAAEVVVPHILGSYRDHLVHATSWPSITASTELFVAFGGIPLNNGQIEAGGVGRHMQKAGLKAARQSGVAFVNISPLRSDILEEISAEWLAPRPCTDTAILLGIAHTLYTEGLYDEKFIEHYSTGFCKFLPYLLGEADSTPKSAEWAAEISALPAEAIRDLARRMARSRTMISVSWSLTRQDHGEQPYWAAITVAAMLGQIGLSGGGIGFGYSASNGVGLHYSVLPSASLPQGINLVNDFIPVARISDLLLNPGGNFDYNGQRYTYPDTRLIYWAGGNPFHHHQDLNRLLHAWRKPETVIVNEWSWNALAKHADIILPCTTPLERNDIAISSRDPYAVYMTKATEPAGLSRNDYDIFRGIARKMAVEQAFSEDRDEASWLRWIYKESRKKAARRGIELPSFGDFKRKGWFQAKAPAESKVMLKAFRDDPKSNRLDTPSGKIEIFSKTIAGFGYDDCPGHATWLEPIEWLGQKDLHHPLHLISNQPKTKLHSQLDHGSHSRSAKIAGREPVTLHPDDAASRGITPGDVVRVYNGRGACLCGAVLSDRIRPGVVQLSTGAWFDPVEPGKPGSICKHGNPNLLTRDKGTSRLAQGPTAHSCLVEVERLAGEAPSVSAFEPPEVLLL